jgi:hypothetical protein
MDGLEVAVAIDTFGAWAGAGSEQEEQCENENGNAFHGALSDHDRNALAILESAGLWRETPCCEATFYAE